MIFVSLTESSARFITGMIAFFLVAAFFGWLQSVTGINAFIWIGIFVFAFLVWVFSITRSTSEGPGQPRNGKVNERYCHFIRANGTQCSNMPINDGLCSHHLAQQSHKKASKAVPVKAGVVDHAARISFKDQDAAYEANFSLLKNLASGKAAGKNLLDKVVSFINAPITEYSIDDRAWRVENLYLAMRFRENKDRSKAQIKSAVFSHTQLNYDYKDPYTDIVDGLYDRLMENFGDVEADKMLRKHIVPLLSQKPTRFPTDLALVNVAAIPANSFLEEGLFGPREGWWLDKQVVQRAYSLDELRVESMRLQKAAGKARFEKYLDTSITSLRTFSKKSLDKATKKQSVNASDLKNGLRWAASFCYAPNEASLAIAEGASSTLLGMVGGGKRTKAMDAAISGLEAFLAYPKGIGTQSQASRQEHLLAELRQTAELVGSGSDPKGREFFDEILELARRVLLLPNAVCQHEQLDALAEVLKFARLNVATLDDEAYVSETSEKLVSELKIVNERRKKATS
jgi:hypothetical protein